MRMASNVNQRRVKELQVPAALASHCHHISGTLFKGQSNTLGLLV